MTTAGIAAAALVVIVAFLLTVVIGLADADDRLPAMLDTDEEDPR